MNNKILAGRNISEGAIQNLIPGRSGDRASPRPCICWTDGPIHVRACGQGVREVYVIGRAARAVADPYRESDGTAGSDTRRIGSGGDREVTGVGWRERNHYVIELLGAAGDSRVHFFIWVVGSGDVEFKLAINCRVGGHRRIADQHGLCTIGSEWGGGRNRVIRIVIQSRDAAVVRSRRDEMIVVPGNHPVDRSHVIIGIGFGAGRTGVHEIVHAVSVRVGVAERHDHAVICC